MYRERKKKILGYKMVEVNINTYYSFTKYSEHSYFYKTKEEAVLNKNIRLSSWSKVYVGGEYTVSAKLCNEDDLSIVISRDIGTDNIHELRLIISEIYDYS